MTYTITQKLLSIGPQYFVCDPSGRERYHVEGELLALGRKLHMYDENHREVALIKQKLPALLPSFMVTVGGREVARIRKEVSLFCAKYMVDGLEWSIKSDFIQRHYSIVDKQGRQIAAIEKEWTLLKDTFTLTLDDSADEVTAIAVVLAIDAVLDAQETAAN